MSSTSSLLICGGRLIDPAQHLDDRLNLLLDGGRIAAVTRDVPAADHTLDATNCLVVPGLIDMHVHLREPGGEHKETLASGTAAAVAGGFTAVGCMPNTTPAIDRPEILAQLQERIARDACCHVYPIAALSLQRQGQVLADYTGLQQAGAVAFSDDGDGLADDALMAEALRRIGHLGGVAIQHCESADFPRGVMHAGDVARSLGLPGMDPLSEELMLARDIVLCERFEAPYHAAHISTARAVDMVRQARGRNVPVSTEVCPHHLLLTDEACRGGDPDFKMHPPLRPAEDVQACIEGVVDGTIDMLVTDHAPHAPEEKGRGFEAAPAGIIGLETALGLFCEALLRPGHLDWPRLIELMSTRPARRFGLPGGTLQPGRPADVTIIDPDHTWRIDPQHFHSKSRNCPFEDRQVRGKAVFTIVGGRLRYDGRTVLRD